MLNHWFQKYCFCLILIQSFVPGQVTGNSTGSFQIPDYHADTLLTTPNQMGLHFSQAEFFSGVGIVLLSGLAAVKFHSTAEKAYHRYLKEGNLDLIDSRYNRARRYDRYTSATYLGVQTGFLLIMKSFYP